MQGKIIRGVGGFYYVYVEGDGIYACRARGIFRKEKVKPLVGDNVLMDVVHEKDREGSVTQILERNNELFRPAVSNVDQALVIFAAADPAPNYGLLDRFLIYMRQQKIPTLICLNKTDLVDEKFTGEFLSSYRNCGCRVLCVSVQRQEGLEMLKEELIGKTTVVAGPSGVGKSSLTNYLSPEAEMETQEVSRKIGRGRHTTRHTQLIRFERDSYFLDTPGFSTLYLQGIEYDQLKAFYPEFTPYEEKCRFQGCLHISEPDCAVKEAAADGRIASLRYHNYVQLVQELRQQRRY